MRWVRLGSKRVNLEFTILCEPWDATPETHDLLPGGVRVTVATGRVLVVPPGKDADKLLRTIDEDIDARDAPPDGATLIGRAVEFPPQQSSPLDHEGGGLRG